MCRFVTESAGDAVGDGAMLGVGVTAGGVATGNVAVTGGVTVGCCENWMWSTLLPTKMRPATTMAVANTTATARGTEVFAGSNGRGRRCRGRRRSRLGRGRGWRSQG